MTTQRGQRSILATCGCHVLEVSCRQVLSGAAHRAPWLVGNLLASALLLSVSAALRALGVLGLLPYPLVLRAP